MTAHSVKDTYSLGIYTAAVKAETDALDAASFARRLWEKDASLWKADESLAKGIRNALGWVGLAPVMATRADEVTAFAREVAKEFTDVVLLGMGGSSLAPLVLARAFGRAKGYPSLTVLDSTCPEALKSVERSVDLKKTLFIVSSKSGTTIEPLSFFEYFYGRLGLIKGQDAAKNFIAITDPATRLEQYAKNYGFRKFFTNPPDIGGRFSALSFFGLVPAALAGIDIKKLLSFAARMEEACKPGVKASESPGLRLGAVLGALYKQGRDKITFLLPDEFSSFGLWTEQLLAESTGKDGQGLVPVSGESAGAVRSYGSDRVFVYIGRPRPSNALENKLSALARAGHPVIRLSAEDACSLGAEFVRWEAATAVAGSIIGINPFDQPDVELSKKLALERLSRAGAGKKASSLGAKGRARITGRGAEVLFTAAAVRALKRSDALDKGLKPAIEGFISLAVKGDYVALLAYFNPFDAALEKELRRLQKNMRDSTGLAVQFGWGPRYLHSTGQLHKGGAGNGLFIIFTYESAGKVEIPGKEFGFPELFSSQALGDMEALESKGRRVMLVRALGPGRGACGSALSTVGQAALKRKQGGKK